MDRWVMVLEAVPGSSAVIRVDDAEYRTIDVELADGDTEVLGASLAELVAAEGSRPDHLVLVVPGDLDEHRFAVLTEAVNLAGLPDPSWLPDAVAWAGDQLARSAAGSPAVVVDTRGDELAVWPVRAADDGVEIAEGGPVDLNARLDGLLSGVVHAKLAVVAPELADSLRDRPDAVSRRDAAHLSRELREARHIMCVSDGEELVVTAGEAEVYLTRGEFTRLVEHALLEIITDGLGDDVTDVLTIVVADRETPVVEHLADPEGADATLLWAPPEASSLPWAAALVLPRHEEDAGPVDDPCPTDGFPLPDDALVPLPRADGPRGDRPGWVVPALSTLLVLVLAGSAAVLVTEPDIPGLTSNADAVSPVGFDGAGDPPR
ncbi:hypothetical protein [Actinomycetospora sp. NBC_00405]|uniref:hypothetical protein n=1 Tax=Actinomycetospora sp. NBC_00405 TaxID=2975952 RepID=UPI002E204B9F